MGKSLNDVSKYKKVFHLLLVFDKTQKGVKVVYDSKTERFFCTLGPLKSFYKHFFCRWTNCMNYSYMILNGYAKVI